MAFEALYGIIMATVKTSVLCLYKRIFPSVGFHRVTYLAMGVLWIWAVVNFLICILQCIPISAVWSAESGWVCLDMVTILTAMGGVNAGTDVMVLSLPISQLLKLQMSKFRKILVVGIFLSGGLTTIVGIVRTIYISRIVMLDGTCKFRSTSELI